MKRHRTASAVSVMREDGRSNERALGRARTAVNSNMRMEPAAREPNLVLASLDVRMHTLTLTGALDHRTAHALEAQIESLCEEGVTGITLDLRELEHIDPSGVAVIAFRCGLCKRRGYDFALIAGSPSVHRAFEQAGVAAMLPFREPEPAPEPVPAPVLALSHRSRDGCEQ
jgi:anti-anti-sigma factor